MNPFKSSARIMFLIIIGPLMGVVFLALAMFGDNGWTMRGTTGGVDHLGRVTVETVWSPR
jgi:hypothetical protein